MTSIRLPLFSNRVRYGIVVVVAVGILLASVGKPAPGTTPYGPFGVLKMDKWSHGLGYGAFTATIAYASVAPVQTDRRWLLSSISIAIVFGVCMELIQGQIPYRTLSAIDATANAVGSIVMASLWLGLVETVQLVEFDSS